MAKKGAAVTFAKAIGLTFPFTKTTYSFTDIVSEHGGLAPFYEKAQLGFSMAGNSGFFGVRVFYCSPAVNRAVANGIQLVTAITGTGASSGNFTLLASGYGHTTFHGLGFPTPTLIEIDRITANSCSGTLIFGGHLYNPVG